MTKQRNENILELSVNKVEELIRTIRIDCYFFLICILILKKQCNKLPDMCRVLLSSIRSVPLDG